MVYAGPWLSARILAGSGGSLAALDSNISVNSYGRTRPEPTTLERFRMEEGRSLLLGEDADVDGIRETLTRYGVPVRPTPIGPYRLFALTRPQDRGRCHLMDGGPPRPCGRTTRGECSTGTMEPGGAQGAWSIRPST